MFIYSLDQNKSLIIPKYLNQEKPQSFHIVLGSGAKIHMNKSWKKIHTAYNIMFI